MANRQAMIDVLKEMGAKVVVGTSTERLEKKCVWFLSGIDADKMTDAQKTLAEDLGLGSADPVGAPKKAPAKKKAKKAAQPAAQPAAKAKKAAKASQPTSTRGNGKSGMAVFTAYINAHRKFTREEVIVAVQKGSEIDIKDYCIANYIALAKKENNQFGVVLVEEKKDGERVLSHA